MPEECKFATNLQTLPRIQKFEYPQNKGFCNKTSPDSPQPLQPWISFHGTYYNELNNSGSDRKSENSRAAHYDFFCSFPGARLWWSLWQKVVNGKIRDILCLLKLWYNIASPFLVDENNGFGHYVTHFVTKNQGQKGHQNQFYTPRIRVLTPGELLDQNGFCGVFWSTPLWVRCALWS